MADDALEGVKGALRSINFADIGVRLSLAAAGVAGAGMLICVPNGRQKDVAADRLFQRPFSELRPTEKRTAEFLAAHRRWTGFFENSVFPLTRKLPGSGKPLLNPYKKRKAAAGGDESF